MVFLLFSLIKYFFQSDKQGGLIYNIHCLINLDVNNHITSLLVLWTYRTVSVLGICILDTDPLDVLGFLCM